jgi:hypothetical protein
MKQRLALIVAGFLLVLHPGITHDIVIPLNFRIDTDECGCGDITFGSILGYRIGLPGRVVILPLRT